MNCTNLKLVEGGKKIKQGDISSIFGFELLDEYKKVIPNLTTASIVLIKDNEIKYKTEAKVINGIVNFSINKVLDVGAYIVEIRSGGFVFPSTNNIVIEVVKSVVDENIKVDNMINRNALFEDVEKYTDISRNADFYKISDRTLFNFCVEKLNALVYVAINENKLFSCLDMFSDIDISNINIYVEKLKTLEITKLVPKIISSSGDVIPNDYKLFPVGHELYDGNFIAIACNIKNSYIKWEVVDNFERANIYTMLNIGDGIVIEDSEFGLDNPSYISYYGVGVLVRYEPNIRFTIRATLGSDIVLEKEFIVGE